MKLKNKYLGIIYKGVVSNDNIRKIHKALYDATINKKVWSKDLLKYSLKLTNKVKKVESRDIVLGILIHNKGNKIINTELRHKSGKEKKQIIKSYLEENRKQGKYYYLASSHDDCAEDHKAYQGKIYVDAKAPVNLQAGYMTVQWVIDEPVYFVTRPNCRHYFVAMDKPSDAKHINAHSKEGDRDFQTPATQAVEEYTERLATLRTLYAQYPTEKLKRMIEKTELLIKKWKKLV